MLAAVLGKPVSHSLSPVLHNAGYAAAGLTGWSYRAIECDEDGLAPFLDGRGPEWAGFSLTMPLKETGLALAAEASPLAAAVGAANTLIHQDGRWLADNTDVPGMVSALQQVGNVSTVDTVAILGAGGTARAAIAAAAQLGAHEITVYARRREAIAQLESVGVPLKAANWADAVGCGQSDVVISTVPKGVADDLIVPWQAGTVLFDALYHPWPTPLAASAQEAGCRIVSGLDLLLRQALVQFELFTGVPAPAEAMEKALRNR